MEKISRFQILHSRVHILILTLVEWPKAQIGKIYLMQMWENSIDLMSVLSIFPPLISLKLDTIF